MGPIQSLLFFWSIILDIGSVTAVIFVLWMAWRFVRAMERIAEHVERESDSNG